MGSKAIVFLGLLVVMILLISSEVAARDLVEETSKATEAEPAKATEAEPAKATEAEPTQYGGGGYGGRGGYGGGRGGYGGGRGGGGGCHCCGRYGCSCC